MPFIKVLSTLFVKVVISWGLVKQVLWTQQGPFEIRHFAGEELHKIFKTLDRTGKDKDYKLASTLNHKRTWSMKAMFSIEQNRILAKHLTSITQGYDILPLHASLWMQRLK